MIHRHSAAWLLAATLACSWGHGLGPQRGPLIGAREESRYNAGWAKFLADEPSGKFGNLFLKLGKNKLREYF